MLDFSDLSQVISLVGSFLVLALIVFVVGTITKKNRLIICCSLFSVSILVTYFFGLIFLTALIGGFYVTFLVSSIFLTMKSYREFFNKSLVFTFKKKKIKGEALFDRDSILPKICDAVSILSKKKVGALITFERKDSMDEYLKSGTIINSPVNSELIQTIFYPGTRLHDGAIVIRLDKIAAASVYFPPTTKPLTGKYGSRHRAALGISEVSDSITIIVSEETGRISIADNGELEAVTSDILLDRINAHLNGKNA